MTDWPDNMPTPTWRSADGSVLLYHADCLDILPQLPDGCVDAVVTDPPYGINAARDRNSQVNGWVDYPCGGWDKARPPQRVFDIILSIGKPTVIWGGNYFSDYLPPSDKWLVWDKGQTDFSLADVELAWCSFGGAARRIMYPRSLALRDGKVHATQKPVDVMVWNIEKLPRGCDVVADPFMGSGTTGVACVRLARRFIGIEIERKYFDIAVRRIEEAFDSQGLFRQDEREPDPELFQGALPAPTSRGTVAVPDSDSSKDAKR